MQSDRTGMRLGQFELLRPLGAGGMGEVWLARQDGLDRHVAVKVLPSVTHRQSIERLRREAQALARIRHPHVVPVHEVGEARGLHYCVMDLVEGRTLEAVLAAGPLPCARAAEIARQIAEALTAAHDQGVIHRDVKPGNVLLADERDHVTLVDFGIALSELAPTLTGTGDLLGTPSYMAPEQARGEAYLADARTDVWGVGATLYEMITGRRPFDGAHAVAIRSAILGDRAPSPPRQLRADCPRDLETIVLHCLDQDPERRYPTARALADDLARFLADEPVHARRTSPGYRLGKHVRRHRGAWLAVAVTAFLGVLGLVASLVIERAAERDRAAAEAAELVHAARGFAEHGHANDAWTRLREVELRFPRTPAMIDAYWAMAELAGRAQGEDDVLAQEVWLDRLLDAGPPASDAARARWRLARIYDKHGFIDDARDLYARAVDSGALSATELDDARFGLQWTDLLGRHAEAASGGRIMCTGDLDREGRDEIVVYAPPDSLAVLRLRADHLELAHRWPLPAGTGANPWCTVADANHDGRPDLVISDGNRVTIDDLDDRGPRQVLTFAARSGAAVGDLDGDGRSEVVMLGHMARSISLVRIAPDWSTHEIPLDDLNADETEVLSLAIADLDGDGRGELIYSGGPWTRYDVRVATLDHDTLRMVARAQVGVILGVAAADLDGDGRSEIFAVQSHVEANPRLFDDDPYLGPGGPLVLRWSGRRLEPTWRDPIVAAAAPPTDLRLSQAGRTRLGPAFVVRAPAGVLHLYFGRPGTGLIRRDLRRLGSADLAEGGVAIVDLDGDGKGELVFGGPHVTAYGVGPARRGPRRERRPLGADWLSTARQLCDADQIDLALDAYRAAAAYGADPGVVAFEEGECQAKAQRWDLALARLRDARAAGRRDAPLWRAMLEAAEAAADWPTALEAARALDDPARTAALDKLTALRTVFVQDFVEPWTSWRIEEPLACRGRTVDGALGLTLLPGDRALALPIDWDGSSFEVSSVVALRELQYAKSFELSLARAGGPEIAGGLAGTGGGGELQVHTYLRVPSADHAFPVDRGTPPLGVDWSVFPERVRLTLSYVDHIGQWQMALDDLGGKHLHRAILRAAGRPVAGRYVLRLSAGDGEYLAASVVDVYRLELRAAPGALHVVPPAAAEPPPRCARSLAPVGASSPLHRAFGLAAAGQIAAAARTLAAWRPSAIAHVSPARFELDAYRVTPWEAGLARLALLDEPLASAVVAAGQLVPRRAWGVLLRRLAYQQDIDSGQTHWREGVIRLRRATELAPDDPDGWYMLGYCLYRLGDLAGARSALERAVALDPEIERHYAKQGGPAILLARIAAQERDVDGADRWLRLAARHGGNGDIARHDHALRALLGDRLDSIVGD